MGRTRRTRKRVVLLALALGLLVTLLSVEALLRVVRFDDRSGSGSEVDSLLGYRLRPNFRGWYRSEGEAFFTVNSDAMPDREREIVKPTGTNRVAVIGDSFTQAPGVPRDRRFPAVIERALANCPALRGRPTEVLAFGASGYGPGQELLLLQRDVWKYAPDVVLLQLFLGNDLRSSVRGLSGPHPAPYFIEVDGVLQRDSASRLLRGPRRTGWLLSLERAAYRWFRSLQLVQTVRATLRRSSEPSAPPYWSAADSTFGFEPGADWQIFLPPATPAWKQAWHTTEMLLAAINEETKDHGARLFVAAIPSGIQVHPNAAMRAAFLAKLGESAALDYPGRQLAEISGRRGINMLDLTPPMLAHAERTGKALYGYPNAVPGLGHWNAEGHRVGGNMIADWLCTSPGR